MPRQPVDKEQATRHLLHSAIRMYAAGEDQFALHLIIQSADKILIDLAKHRNVSLGVDWERMLPKKLHKEFFVGIRQPYNFLKHANNDADQKIDWETIADFNFLQLTVCCRHFQQVFGYSTRHMEKFSAAALAVFFSRVESNFEGRSVVESFIAANSQITVREFLASIFDRRSDPKLALEAYDDLQHSDELLNTKFVALADKYQRDS